MYPNLRLVLPLSRIVPKRGYRPQVCIEIYQQLPATKLKGLANDIPRRTPKRSLQLLLAIALALFPLTLASAKTAHAQEPKSSSASSQNSAANSPIKRAVESDSIDNDDTTSQASESEAPIVDWTKTGTCRWMIDASGCLTIEPLPGNQSGDLVVFPWQIGLKGDSIRNRISSVTIRGSVHVSNEDSLHRISTGGMFAKCENLKTADLSGLDTSDAVYMWGMFSDCPSLKSLNLSSLDTSSAENMETMFWGCSSLSPSIYQDGTFRKLRVWGACSKIARHSSPSTFPGGTCREVREVCSGVARHSSPSICPDGTRRA